jgi:DNA repair protein RadC
MDYRTSVIQLPLVKDRPAKIVRKPAEVAELCVDMADLAQESFHVLLLNTKNRLISRCLISLGTINASLVSPREVFRQAVVESAVALIIVHNHPSGDSSPSAEDVRITRQLIEAGNILGIAVMDHVIIGRKSETQPGYFSIRESGICDFNAK